MPGAPDPEYVLARRVLLDALQALGEQRSAVVLVGAQAIYLHTGDADLAVAPYTTDGDVAIDPSRLRNDPKLAEALGGAGFSADTRYVGTWIMSRPLEGRAVEVKIDLMVPEAVGGPAAARVSGRTATEPPEKREDSRQRSSISSRGTRSLHPLDQNS